MTPGFTATVDGNFNPNGQYSYYYDGCHAYRFEPDFTP